MQHNSSEQNVVKIDDKIGMKTVYCLLIAWWHETVSVSNSVCRAVLL